MENTRNKPVRRRLPLAVYLAFLLVAALAFTGASAASYKTVATGSDSARVARFVVTAMPETNQSKNLTLDSSNPSAAYTFTVSNSDTKGVNETATRYDVNVVFPNALSGVSLTLKNGTNAAISATPSADSKTFAFTNVGTFSAGTPQTHNLILTFTAGTDAAGGSWSNIKITVNAEQVD